MSVKGEKYTSKVSMMKHEKSESSKTKKAEYSPKAKPKAKPKGRK